MSTTEIRPSGLIARAEALAEATAPLAAGIDAGTVPCAAAYDRLRDSGLLTLLVPRAHGGDAASFADYTRVLETVALRDTPTALGLNMHFVAIASVCESGDAGLSGGAARFRDWLFAEVVEHRRVFASATSESGGGAKLGALRTTYTASGDGFVLRGAKSFVSLAGVADHYLVAARSGEEDAADEVSHFVVSAHDPGVRFGDYWQASAMAGTSTASMFLDEVRLGRDRLMMDVEGMSMFKLAREPHWMIAGYTGAYLGLARAIFDELAAVVAGDERKRTDPVTVQRIGRLAADLRATRALVYAAARTVDEARGSAEANQAVHAAKYQTGRLLGELDAAAVRLAGTRALQRGGRLERLLREAPFCSAMPAKPDECEEYLGKAALGVDLRNVRNFRW